ncbi:MAG TPA: flagellar biosynthesis anti-sigma factor FlgM [Acidocella sp.]|jgi:flagellar biosynthesis anti-sigma factor FlgM|uniref:flagellar biosynthesis anti-sigma factor FlgM n=1 Tax=Acidocella sp. TaxID=50710 RepID=UPI002BC83BE1|nr:flagellar biosynthesis anti-sigma factor FlgM [Acidocella sp.]HVE22010.1 flagellar biosynthesis anti-sigma factor FlgM [Acidocella sp.]
MTSSINALGQSQVAPEIAGQDDAVAVARTGAAAETAASESSGEAVTLSADAQTTTQLLDAARNSSGVNEQAVAQLRAAVQNGTYSVPPDTLARSIRSAMKESAP